MPNPYVTGTVSVSPGDTVLVGTDTIWTGDNVEQFDTVIVDGVETTVLGVVDVTHLTIPPWQGAAKTSVAYEIWPTSRNRVGSVEIADDLRKQVQALNTQGFYVFVPPDQSVPDPSLGEEGQSAKQTSTGKEWHKESGVWVFDGIFKGLGPAGAYDAGTTYSTGAIVSSGGGSYISRIDGNIGHDPATSPDQWMVNSEQGEHGADGATIIEQNSAPSTGHPAGSLWIDADSADLDVYQLGGSPLGWNDTGINLKGATGPQGPASDGLTIVRLAATANVNISSGLVNAATIDGVAVATGQLVLLTGQTAPAENGVYAVVASGAASRATGLTTFDSLCGRYFSVMEGTAGHDKLYRCTSDKGGTLGTTAIVISEFSSATVSAGAGIKTTVAGNAVTVALDGPFGFRNRVINPSGQINQSGSGTAADGTYWYDQWVVLTQSNPINPYPTSNAENGTPFMMGYQQSNATAQRFGKIQPIESANCIDLRGQAVTLSARLVCSVSTTLRYAIIEWTGTADAITKDVVNDWTNGTFTPGNFFNASNLTIAAIGSAAVTANVGKSIEVTGNISGSMNNLLVFFWTDSAQAQGVNVYFGKVQLEQGSSATPLAFRSVQQERDLCYRYFEIGDVFQSWPNGLSLSASTFLIQNVPFKARKFKVPAISETVTIAQVGTPWVNQAPTAAGQVTADSYTSNVSNTSGAATTSYMNKVGTYIANARM